MELKTERLRLRKLAQDDWQWIVSYQSDPDVNRFLLSHGRSEDHVRQFVRTEAARAVSQSSYRFSFAIEIAAKNKPVGLCSYIETSRCREKAHIGWDLDKEFWNRGYATEAVGRLIEFGFEARRVERIIADCFPANHASRRVMEKVGMRQVSSGWWYRWYLASQYCERRPIVRYAFDRSSWCSDAKRQELPMRATLSGVLSDHLRSRRVVLLDQVYCLQVPGTENELVTHRQGSENYVFLFDNEDDAFAYSVAVAKALGFTPKIVERNIHGIYFQKARYIQAGGRQKDITVPKNRV